MDKKGKEGSFTGIFIVLLASLAIAFLWDSVSWIRGVVSSVLDPTAGTLLGWNLTEGMIIIILIISIFITLIQKYATDQKTIKETKKEQKRLSDEMKKFRSDPEKVMELQRETLPLAMKAMKLSMRPIIYTGIPLILFFRWFMEYFAAAGDPQFFGIFSWFWFYLIGSIIFSSILRKILKVA